MKINIRCKRIAAGLLALVSLGLVSAAWAQVAVMPDRGAFDGTSIVVWGNTTLPGGTAYEFDFGDGSPVVTGSVNAASQSYIATTHAFTTALAQEDFTVTFTVGTDTATAVVRVYDPTALTPDQVEEQQINNAIQDGLRYQYYSVDSREVRHDGSWTFASWNNTAYTSMAVLAFENHGYTIGSGDIYSPVVQGGLNTVFNGLAAQPLAVQPAGDPCVGGIPSPCNGLRTTFSTGYSTSIALLAITGSQAPGATVGAGLGPASGQTYLEVAQRLVNTVAWGQAENPVSARGGWRYNLNFDSDGSAIGWNVLGLLDAAAFGATIPAFVASELEHEIAQTTSTNGGMGYQFVGQIANTAKTGVRLQALSFIGVPIGGTSTIGTVTPQASVDYINDGWNTPGNCQWGGTHPYGSPFLVNGRQCIYSTFNVFKGLKLYGVTTLPAVTRPDKDWHKDYQMYLVGIQAAPSSPTGGHFHVLDGFSFAAQGDNALALLVLSSTALILPDPVKFATLGLQPFTAENFVDETHTVTAHAEGACSPDPCTGAPVPGATVDFEVLTGPSAGATGTAITDASGNATFTYDNPTDSVGTDTIQANIGLLYSNVVEKNWVPRDDQPPIASNLVVDPNPVGINTMITVTANIDDTTTGGSDILTAYYTVDGGTPEAMAASDSAFDSPTEDVTATLMFAEAGVHTICVYGYDVIVPDPSNVICVLLAVYDPSAGFVTGGGWINSPVGAYVPDPTLYGKATFGFVSKYKRGQSIPDGNTQFQFHAADMKFKSTAYDWLVIAGKRAQYKGVGTINGMGNYGFMLFGIDGDLQGGDGIDKFRIKIWDKDAGDAVVYDNEIAAGEDAEATTALGGGSIVIHSK